MDRNRLVKLLLNERVRIFSYIWTIVRDEHLAEDIFQDVWMLVLEKADELVDGESVRGWVLRAARNKALETVRTRSREKLVFSEAAQQRLDAAWVKPASRSTEQAIDALRECITQLTPNARQLIHFRYKQGLTGADLAEAVGKNLTATYVAVSRVNKILAECVERRLAEDAR